MLLVLGELVVRAGISIMMLRPRNTSIRSRNLGPHFFPKCYFKPKLFSSIVQNHKENFTCPS